MSELTCKKIYIDSRFRTPESSSDSNFKVQLGRTIYLPDKCVMRVEHCCIPHSWFTIEQGINDSMYLVVTISGTTTYTILTIPSTNYTGPSLVTALQSLLNTAYSGVFTVSYNVTVNSLSVAITSGNTFRILTDTELLAGWAGPSYDVNSPNSCNDIILNRTPYYNTHTSPWTSGCINLQGFRAVYIQSSTLSNYQTLGARGENTIIKKVSTSSDFGYLIVTDATTDHDFLPCDKKTVCTIDFRITDVKGNEIPFHDSPISFNIVFSVQE